MRKNKRNDVLQRIISKLRPPQSSSAGPRTLQGPCCGVFGKQLVAATKFIELLARNECFPHIGGAIKPSVIERLVEFLLRHDLPQLQLETTLAITVIASWEPEQIEILIQKDAVIELG